MTVDGLNVGNPPGGNQPPGYSVDVGNSQEISFTTSGGLGESETAGLVMNIVPKTGGNCASGILVLQRQRQEPPGRQHGGTGLAAATPLTKVYDLNAAVGGPIKKDRVWYFVTARTQGSTRANANQFVNLNAGDPTKWLYAPDPSQPGFSDRTWENVSGRLTWQVTPRNKIGALLGRAVGVPEVRGQYDRDHDACRWCHRRRMVPNQTLPLRVPQVTWSSPVTNRLLLEAGFGGTYYGWGNFERNPNPTHDLIKVTEQCAAGCARQRQSSGHRLSLAGLWRQPHRVVHLESVGVVRHRRAQHEGRLSAHPDDRRSHVVDEHAGSLVSLQQRRAESAHRRPSRRGSTTRAPAGTRSSRRSSGRSAG